MLGAVYGQLVDGSDSYSYTSTEAKERASDETIKKEGKERARDEYVADRMRDISERITLRYLDEATGQLNHFVPHTHGYDHVAFGSGRRYISTPTDLLVSLPTKQHADPKLLPGSPR